MTKRLGRSDVHRLRATSKCTDEKRRTTRGAISDRRYDGFVGCALSAVIDAQIKAGFFRLDTGQYQRPAAFGAGRPKVVDKLKIKRVHHGTDQSAPLRLK